MINCFYHYKCNIIKNAKLLGLCNKKNKDIDINITKKIINELCIMPLKYNGNVNYVLDKIKDLSKAYPYYNNFLNEYFVKNKIKYFIDDSLNYSKYPKNVRSNSILERYNRHVKEQINKKRYCNWIIFLKFINTELSRVDNILSKNENINIAFSKKN